MQVISGLLILNRPEDVVSFVCCLLGHGEYGLSNQSLCIFDLAPADSSVFMQAGQGTLVSGCE